MVQVWGYPRPGVPAVGVFGLVRFHSHVNRTECFLITAAVCGVVPVTQPKGTEESGGNDGLSKLLVGSVNSCESTVNSSMY